MFANVLVSDYVPEGTILLLPPITLTYYLNKQTGEVKEYLNFNPKAAGFITNVES